MPHLESQNTNPASLAYQNPLQFFEIKHSNLSIKTKLHILFPNNNKNSSSLSISRTQLTNNQKSFFAPFRSTIQSTDTSKKFNPHFFKQQSTICNEKQITIKDISKDIALCVSQQAQCKTRPANNPPIVTSVPR